MKKTLLLSVLALLLAVGQPYLEVRVFGADRPLPDEPAAPRPAGADAPAAAEPEAVSVAPENPDEPAPAAQPEDPVLRILTPEGERDMPLQDYLVGVVAAEMPADFEPEALCAQAVAARTYALYQAQSGKHGAAQLCTDPGCCQAWLGDAALRERWGDDYEEKLSRVRAAVGGTAGELLRYEGEPICAVFHSSSAGATEDSGAVWNARPYLVSVSSPETAADVPNFISYVQCTALDLRDTVLSAHPEADFTGEPETWLGETERDDSGRVAALRLGGVRLSGAELRTLFSLRSTAFTLECVEGAFRFTVTGFGHGVGMSQYGAQVMALGGADHREILTHYYPGAELTGA